MTISVVGRLGHAEYVISASFCWFRQGVRTGSNRAAERQFDHFRVCAMASSPDSPWGALDAFFIFPYPITEALMAPTLTRLLCGTYLRYQNLTLLRSTFVLVLAV